MYADEIRYSGDRESAVVSFTASTAPSPFPLVTDSTHAGIKSGVTLLPSSTIKVSNAGGLTAYMLNDSYEWNQI